MSKKQIKQLSMWEWSTLVASWRYFEHRATIASAQFPCDIIERFWKSGKYAKNVLDKIARQFAEIDHGLKGEDDWSGCSVIMDCDVKAWCKFYAFCKAWCHGFKTLHVSDGKKSDDIECFYCERTKRWHPKDKYIENPYPNCWIPNEYIKEVK